MCVLSQGNNPVRLTENYHSAAVIVRVFKPAHCHVIFAQVPIQHEFYESTNYYYNIGTLVSCL